LPIAVVANSIASAKSMSGGDRILIELSKRWIKAGHLVDIYSCKEGITIFAKSIPGVQCLELSTIDLEKCGVIIGYIGRIVQSFTRLRTIIAAELIYSSSDFLTDLIPACLMKIRSRNSKLVSGFYLSAPSPFSEKYSRTITGLAYFFSQRLAIVLMRLLADRVYVLDNNDCQMLERLGIPRTRIKLIRGGVDSEFIHSVPRHDQAVYDACFIGRIHEQKGIFDLVSIWALVCKDRPDSKLVILGWGDSGKVARLKNEIVRHDLTQNVDFLGFLDGPQKIAILKSSRILVFPSVRESWGIVVAEALTAAIPVVSYDLPILKDRLSYGVRTVPLAHMEKFARAVLQLLQDPVAYERAKDECAMISSTLDWDSVAQETLLDFQALRTRGLPD